MDASGSAAHNPFPGLVVVGRRFIESRVLHGAYRRSCHGLVHAEVNAQPMMSLSRGQFSLATRRYYIRAKAIANNEKDGYFDPYGPPVLAALLTVVILLTLIDAFRK